MEASIDQVLLAIPSLERSGRRRIVDALQRWGFCVLQVPSVDDLTSGRARMVLRTIAIEDLLGRDEVPADPALGPGISCSVSVLLGQVDLLVPSFAARSWPCLRLG